jgi:hypothetical protein
VDYGSREILSTQSNWKRTRKFLKSIHIQTISINRKTVINFNLPRPIESSHQFFIDHVPTTQFGVSNVHEYSIPHDVDVGNEKNLFGASSVIKGRTFNSK